MSTYITTPIYYVNDTPHIGHAYTTVIGDVLSRYHRLFGDDTFFLTGTDEHGQKVQNAAKARGLTPQQHCDEMVLHFQKIWQELNIKPDFFIRTTMDFHVKAVQACLLDLHERGEIYSSEYEGWYSVSEEIFYTEEELIDGKSPVGKEVTKIKEKNYFFRMSNYQERLIAYINDHPDFIQPTGKKSEVLGFLRKPLADLCISRPKSKLTWGIELPFDPDFVTYVWFDALLNYATALGFKQPADDRKLFERYWSSAIHLIGKDILTTHAVYWPTMLMALGAPLPKTIFAHGWWLTAGDKKMSKSEGPVVKPLDMRDIVGVDPLRYFLIRDRNPASDGQFSQEIVISRVNSDLANNLGNLVSRAVALVIKYFEGKIPQAETKTPESVALIERAKGVAAKVKEHIELIAPNRAAEEIFELLSETNRYVDGMQPWKSAKEDPARAAECLYVTLETVRIAAILLSPIMPTKMPELLSRIAWKSEPRFADASRWGLLSSGATVTVGDPLFMRIETPKP